MSAPSGYSSLFTNLGPTQGTRVKAWATNDPEMSFARKFGFARLIERQDNLVSTLTKPQEALNKVGTDLEALYTEKAGRYQKILYDFKNLGFSEEESIARADALIGREIQTDLALIQIKNPYAVGGAEAGGWDPLSALMKANPLAQDVPRTFAAIQSSNHLGLGGGVNKGDKRRLKRKMKRRMKRKAAAAKA